MLGRFIVDGDSMLPTFRSGDHVISIRIPTWILRTGMIIDVSTNTGMIIKRVASIDREHITLISDNKDTQSRYCGTPISKSAVIGIVIYRY